MHDRTPRCCCAHVLAFGLAFLYVPILSMMVFSFKTRAW